MGSRPAVYLAGHIAGLTYGEANDWREEAAEVIGALGYDVYSPMRGKEHLSRAYETRAFDPSADVGGSIGVFQRDMYDIKRSDVILANMLALDTPGLGTPMEIMAGHLLGKFVILVVSKAARAPMKDAKGWHPFLVGTADAIVNTLEEAYEVLEVLRPAQPAKVQLSAPMFAVSDSFDTIGSWSDELPGSEEDDDAPSS